MKKNVSLITGFLLMTTGLLAQKTENDPTAGAGGRTGTAQTKEQYYALNPKEDKSETIDITGTGSMSFSVSNKSHGSAASTYTHSEKITLSISTNTKNTTYQLIFYSDKEYFQNITTQEGSIVSVYFPMSMYTEIKQKIDQFLAAKKKVQLKLTQKAEGFTEATLLF